MQVTATDGDKDRPQNIVYFLTGQGIDPDNPANSKFDINRTTGEIFVLKVCIAPSTTFSTSISLKCYHVERLIHKFNLSSNVKCWVTLQHKHKNPPVRRHILSAQNDSKLKLESVCRICILVVCLAVCCEIEITSFVFALTCIVYGKNLLHFGLIGFIFQLKWFGEIEILCNIFYQISIIANLNLGICFLGQYLYDAFGGKFNLFLSKKKQFLTAVNPNVLAG